MKTQQRVELKFGTYKHKSGTVSRVFWDGSFRVSFDSYHENGKRISGGRYEYPASAAASFTVLS